MESQPAHPIKLIALLKAKPGMSREAFTRRWIEQHAPFNLAFKNLKGYRVNIALEHYQDMPGEPPFDGTAELWWDSLEEMLADFQSPEGQRAGADADEFAIVRTHVYTREYIVK